MKENSNCTTVTVVKWRKSSGDGSDIFKALSRKRMPIDSDTIMNGDTGKVEWMIRRTVNDSNIDRVQ